MKKTLKAVDWRQFAAGALSIVCFLLVWQLAVWFTAVGEMLPGPFETLAAFCRSWVEPIGRETMGMHILWSLSRVLTGFAVASVVGIVVGILMGVSRVFCAIIQPLYEMIRPIPPIAWIPLIVLWCGLGEFAKYVLIFIATFCNIVVNVYRGACTVDPVLIGAARMLGAGPVRIFFTVRLPSAVPYIFAGLQVAISVSWRTAMAAEMIRANEGVGWIIINAQAIYDVTQMLVGIIAIGITGFVLAAVMREVEKRLCAWNKA